MRSALIIANTEYVDPGLAQLTAPGKDAEDFARVLKSPDLCAFDDVNILLNQPSFVISEAIEAFFYQKKPDDLLIVYFSGHGVRDEYGTLYLAVKNTNRTRLRATAIRSDYIREAMDQSRSKRQVVILDCCNSGAFSQGIKAEVGGMMGIVSALQGYGRFVLTASDATQFAWEGDKVIGETDNSLFTHFLVKGLEGEADGDSDGKITVDELYDYAYDQISRITPKQTPTKSASKVEGEIVLRQITRIQDIKPVALPDDLISEIDDLRPSVREWAVQRLEKIVKGKNIGMARSAREALEKIAKDDDSRRVSQAATQILDFVRQEEKKAEEERRAKEEAERLAALRAEEERLAREKAEAERKAKEEAERLERAKAEREAAELAAREAAEKAKREKEEKEAAERAAIQKAEREAMELAARKKAEREAAERAEREAKELAARRKAEREAAEQALLPEERRVAKLNWPMFATVGLISIAVLAVFVAIRFLPSLFASNPPATEPPITEAAPTESPATQASVIGATQPSVSNVSLSGIETPNDLHSSDPTTYVEATDILSSIDTFDPALAYNLSSGAIIQNTYEPLVYYDGEATDQFVPLLAESWDTSGDGKTWTFYIRQGVKFHNGDVLTPTDVAYSFQRGILQGGTASPQWLLTEPLLGIGIDDISLLVDPQGTLYDDRGLLQKFNNSAVRGACEKVQDAIRADDTAGTVTIRLSQSWGPFLSTIAQYWGSIIDKKWVIDNNGWDGSCDTWQNFYAMQAAADPFSAIENGTGPFKIESYEQGKELVLTRNDSYWREPAKLERVTLKQVDDWATRFSMIQAGDADSVRVSPEGRSQMDELVGERCEFDLDSNTYKRCEVVDSTKPLRVRIGRPEVTQNVIIFNFNITQADNPYIGSGKLDGNGIPPNFFGDIHIRKAFAYCFDWDGFIQTVYNGEAIQSLELPLPGMPGYFSDSPHYTLDTAKCEEEFKSADVDKDGVPAGQDSNDVWEMGFRIQISYNQDNTIRQSVAENLSRNLRALSDKFRVETVGLPWPSYLNAQRAKQLPIMTAAWLEDIHDPHNLFQPYTVGAYASRQNLPPELIDQFRSILERGFAEADPAVRSNVYKEANQLYYNQAIGLPLALSTSHTFEQRWVFGRISNPIFPGTYYYSIYKH